jgi:N-acetylmuramoyl-L-alanine amidase
LGLADPSPNHDARPAGTTPDLLVLHYTGMATGMAALARLRDPAAKVSAHYLVEEDGRIRQLVAEERRAWHAGLSAWRGRSGLNDVAIGIEIVNPGHGWGYRSFPERQVAAVIELASDIVGRHAIAPGRVVAHSDVAPDRKIDPGELFPWARLAAAGIGLWPADAPPTSPEPDEAGRLLAGIGYPTGAAEQGLVLALAAFQRRFRPWRVDGRLDAGTMGRLRVVHELAVKPG